MCRLGQAPKTSQESQQPSATSVAAPSAAPLPSVPLPATRCSPCDGSSSPDLQVTPQDFPSIPSVKVVDWIPRAARHQAGLKFDSILQDVVRLNSIDSWNRLFLFPTSCLRVPYNDDSSKSLTSKIKEQILLEDPPPVNSSVKFVPAIMLHLGSTLHSFLAVCLEKLSWGM